MQEPTASPSQIVTNSTSSFANDPLLRLLQPKPLHLMSQDEIRKQVNELRTLRTSPQALGRALREEAAVREAKSERAAKPQASLDDMLKGMGL